MSFSSDPLRVLEGTVFEEEYLLLLKPKAPEMLLDKHYILSALGLLARSEPVKA